MKILVHIHPKLDGRTHQRLRMYPTPQCPLWCVRGRAHISFADALSGTQLRRIVVQEDFRMGKHHQQGLFLDQRPGEAFIQLLVAADLPEEEIKRSSQCLSLCRTGIVSVGQEVSVERPERLGELLQEVAMGKEAWCEFLVMTIFMDPAQGQLDRQSVELGRIITQQQLNDWVGGLGSVGRDRQGFLHALAQIGPVFGQVRIQHGVEVVFRVRLTVGQQRGKQTTPLLRHAELRQQGHRRGHSSERRDRLPRQEREAASSDLWPARYDRQ